MTRRASYLVLAALLGVGSAGGTSADVLKSSGAKSKEPMAFQADEVEYDEQLSLTVAKGHVEISQGPEVLLADVVRRTRLSAVESVAKEEVIFRAVHRRERGATKRVRVRRPGVDDPRPRLVVLASGDSRGHGEKKLLNGASREQAAEQ
jgi:hypothetical protein